ncbi:Flp pilus assembly protein CpaB, partial [Vibrio parahaemolyticus]|nr:Flp pilus assembly protein CpaB [Vibrio parahaemolyticus]
VIKNIKELAVDQTAKNNDNKHLNVRAVTIEVTQKEEEKLISAKSNSQIQLELRNHQEQDKPDDAIKYTPRTSVTLIKGSQ